MNIEEFGSLLGISVSTEEKREMTPERQAEHDKNHVGKICHCSWLLGYRDSEGKSYVAETCPMKLLACTCADDYADALNPAIFIGDYPQ